MEICITQVEVFFKIGNTNMVQIFKGAENVNLPPDIVPNYFVPFLGGNYTEDKPHI